ncbi:DUF6054 family protein [Streptococcus moroccensis]|uniref:Uncharacterized protein n=1 Tax=Streptococcus moroccensis TaxID=1451356 RepID=A0ABT9YTC7_9STRE|nr:DUF6054 family protein [Streptococcus moroccensis]MDQ0223240.1 hypothetical protein [Streptococcus moroccensis]
MAEALELVAISDKDIDAIADCFTQDLLQAVNGQLVFDKRRHIGDVKQILLVFEAFYIRTGSYGSLTVNLTASTDYHCIDLIPSGGGDGILNISWGANANFAQKAQEIFESYGYKRQGDDY